MTKGPVTFYTWFMLHPSAMFHENPAGSFCIILHPNTHLDFQTSPTPHGKTEQTVFFHVKCMGPKCNGLFLGPCFTSKLSENESYTQTNKQTSVGENVTPKVEVTTN